MTVRTCRFMYPTIHESYQHKRREMYLKTICSESGVCIAFEIEAVKIKEYLEIFICVCIQNQIKITKNEKSKSKVYKIY